MGDGEFGGDEAPHRLLFFRQHNADKAQRRLQPPRRPFSGDVVQELPADRSFDARPRCSAYGVVASMSPMRRAAERYAFILSRLLQSNSTP